MIHVAEFLSQDCNLVKDGVSLIVGAISVISLLLAAGFAEFNGVGLHIVIGGCVFWIILVLVKEYWVGLLLGFGKF